MLTLILTKMKNITQLLRLKVVILKMKMTNPIVKPMCSKKRQAIDVFSCHWNIVLQKYLCKEKMVTRYNDCTLYNIP